MRILTLVTALLLAGHPATAQARPAVGAGLAASTMGLAVDGAVRLAPRVDLRGRFAWMPFQPEVGLYGGDEFGVQVTLDLPSPQLALLVDFQLAGPLRATAGVRYAADDFRQTAAISGTAIIGDSTYTGAQLGDLTATIATRTLAPYLGLGLGRVAGRGFGIFLDAGVAFHGSPRVDLQVSGPIASQPTFQAELAQEVAEDNADIAGFKYYPVLAVGLRLGL